MTDLEARPAESSKVSKANEHADGTDSIEKCIEVREEFAPSTKLKLDMDDIPSVLQASDNPGDPLNWALTKKAYTAVLVSTLAFLGQLGASLISPAFVIMSEDLEITVQQASYAVTTYLIVAGITPMFIIPLTTTYGRRPAYIFSALIGIAGGIGSGAAPTWGLQQFCRVLHGLGSGLPLALAPATIADMFVPGQRGLWLGLYVLMVNNGPHIGPIIGGFVALRVGWRWCFYIPGILLAGVWVVAVFTLPETLYSRAEADNFKKQSYIRSKFTVSRVVKRKLKVADFIRPFYMGQYAAVLFPAIFFGTSNLFGSVLFTVTIAFTTKKLYQYDPSQTGLLLGVPLTIGCMLGEASAGWVSDYLTNLHAKRTGVHKAESRLLLAPFALLTAAGTIGYGWAVQHEESWIRLAVCLAITGCGVQYGSTCVYTYVTDSYKPQSPECGALLNLIKSLFAFTSGYYALPYSLEVGFGKAFTLFGCMNALSIIPLFALYFVGERVRARQGEPKFHKGL